MHPEGAKAEDIDKLLAYPVHPDIADAKEGGRAGDLEVILIEEAAQTIFPRISEPEGIFDVSPQPKVASDNTEWREPSDIAKIILRRSQCSNKGKPALKLNLMVRALETQVPKS